MLMNGPVKTLIRELVIRCCQPVRNEQATGYNTRERDERSLSVIEIRKTFI